VNWEYKQSLKTLVQRSECTLLTAPGDERLMHDKNLQFLTAMGPQCVREYTDTKRSVRYFYPESEPLEHGKKLSFGEEPRLKGISPHVAVPMAKPSSCRKTGGRCAAMLCFTMSIWS